MKRRALALVLAAGFVVGSYATDARVAVMGRQNTPWFYRDEVTVFNNPADMNRYPNMLYGSFGHFSEYEQSGAHMLQNLLPSDPHFGVMLSQRLGKEANAAALSIGAFVNRRDYMVEQILQASGGGFVFDFDEFTGTNKGRYEYNLPDPTGKVDVMFGYDMGNGIALGLGMYVAVQNDLREDRYMELYKGSFGVNWNIERGLDLEASVNYGMANAKYITPENKYAVISDGDYLLRGDVRFFSAVPSLNGAFVPQVSLEIKNLAGSSVLDLNGGVGLNMNIDRGFFWAGVQGIYTQESFDESNRKNDEWNSIGARLSFGIERNIIWDWFLVRVGGQKEIRRVAYGDGKITKWAENPASDGSDNDLVGLGFGVNLDNRLRIDVVASEDLPYTFTNLISGNAHHLFNRVSATYRF